LRSAATASTTPSSAAPAATRSRAATATTPGGNGNDRLIGGAGNDVLTGGIGNDAFRFDSAFIGVTNIDTVVGFDAARDVIELDHSVFAGFELALGQLGASAFALGSATWNGAADRLRHLDRCAFLRPQRDRLRRGSCVCDGQGRPGIERDEFLRRLRM
jgi:hypothetical protein